MPELPEVESVRRGLERSGSLGQPLLAMDLRRPDLRTPLDPAMAGRLRGQTLKAVRRRAKYLLFDWGTHVLISHLGMSGSWRTEAAGVKTPFLKHDHVVLTFADGRRWIFHDPRRFGLLELAAAGDLERSRWLRGLGDEPLDDAFDSERLHALTRGRRVAIKTFLMDQKRVVGVGNIYASEALFAAGVRPTRPSYRCTRAECGAIVAAVKDVLSAAIASGGSTIRDYRDSGGGRGAYQDRLLVYDRANEACRRCGGAIRARVLNGRSTYWCPRCQR